jgi:hypothetical protein
MSGWQFDRARIGSFRFVAADYDATTGEARLSYAFDDGPLLVERLQFPDAPAPRDTVAVARALRLVHLIAGVSYYKAAVPRELRVETGALDDATATLLDDVYVHGLEEFAWRNGMDLRGSIRFPRGGTPVAPAPALGLPRRSLVAIGGGKDSLVSTELLRGHGDDVVLAWVGDSPLIAAVAQHTGLPTLNIRRTLAPELFEFNRQGALNGHVPVTAINSAILVLAALLYGFDTVVFSNEHSASSATLESGGRVVNHQWSKGIDFERGFASLVRTQLAADLSYFSLLRPLTELAVAREFARLGRYHRHFSSCNRNFRILGERPRERWCGQCPKCHFVFLALAPFLPKPALVAIFGRNLLDDAALAPAFDALIEWHAHKPFECVGEAAESRAAFAALASRAEWREDALVRRFAREIAPVRGDAIVPMRDLLEPRPDHALPPRYRELIDALRGA